LVNTIKTLLLIANMEPFIVKEKNVKGKGFAEMMKREFVEVLLFGDIYKYEYCGVIYEWIFCKSPSPAARKAGAKTKEMIADNLMRMFKEGPEVSFNGSPTVSPTTAAL